MLLTSAAGTEIYDSKLRAFHILYLVKCLDNQGGSHLRRGGLLDDGQSMGPFCCKHSLATTPEKGRKAVGSAKVRSY